MEPLPDAGSGCMNTVGLRFRNTKRNNKRRDESKVNLSVPINLGLQCSALMPGSQPEHPNNSPNTLSISNRENVRWLAEATST